jgi:DNA-binding helix-hairpin-helix protein with protein kinase domain
VRTASGRPIRLGTALARGGEGVIHELVGDVGRLAKIYPPAVAQERATKLTAMLSLPSPPNCAWPSDIVLNDRGAVVGFLMPRFSGRLDIHNVFATAARQRHFPNADYAFLVAVATNLARAVAAVHEAGHVIGDINDGFAMVAADATVKLTDCDSFQIQAGDQHFTCDVGVLMYQPPELQSVQTFRGLRRIRNHDCFGLAVLIFQLLFLARHPFAGRPLTADVPALEEAIRHYLFAYAPDIQRVLAPPPNTLPLSAVSPRIREFFVRAFGPMGADKGRPTARAWTKDLVEFAQQLRICKANRRHRHLGDSCALCALEATSGTFFFLPPAIGEGIDFARKAETLWAPIAMIQPPTSWGQPPTPQDFNSRVRATPPSMNARRVQRILFGLALGAGGVTLLAFEKLIGIFVIIAALYFVFGQVEHPERKVRDNELRVAQQEYRAAVARWQEADPPRRFASQLDALARLKNQLEGLQTKRLARMRALHGSALDAALKTFLRAYDIRRASIEGIGPARVAVLESNGIETAADVSRVAILAVPGFGPQLTARLEHWRDGIAARFTPPSTGAIDAQAVMRLEAELAAEAAPLITKLSAGPAALAAIASHAPNDHSQYLSAVEVAARALAKAQADLDAVVR